MAKVKVQVTIDEALLARVDSYSDDNYMTRSGLISMATAQFLNSQEAFSAIREMAVAMRKIADSGKVDAETMHQLEDFERISKMLVGK